VSRGTWTQIRQSNRFYVDTYRRALIALVFSSALSVFLLIAIFHVYFGQPEHDFYATDGVTPPLQLTAMDIPNYSSVPLLANDQEPESNVNAKAVPK